ncbi:hypothetical protein FOZ63_020651, partial [Perkinsus olseni]
MGVDVQKSYQAAWDTNQEALMAAFEGSSDSKEQDRLLKDYEANRVMPELPQPEEPTRKSSSRKHHEPEKARRSVGSEKAASVADDKPAPTKKTGSRKSTKATKKEAAALSRVEPKEEALGSLPKIVAAAPKATEKPSSGVRVGLGWTPNFSMDS